MRRRALGIFLLAIVPLLAGVSAAPASLSSSSSIKDSQSRSVVYNPCDEKPKSKSCDVKY
jgi:hypothetical protein